jgi:hypothetical protein
MMPAVRNVPVCAALFVAVALTGCQHQQTISYPKLAPAGAIEGGFDCAQLDDAILRTDAVRWVMREDGARLISPGQQLTAALLFPLAFEVPDEGHIAVHRADLRLVSLLSLKKVKHCSPRSTGHQSMTDLELYELVAELLSQENSKDTTLRVSELRTRRMQLLDKLRPD